MEKMTKDRPLTEKEKAWIKEYFKAGFNATEASRRAYGGTALSCKVKGHKKLKKLEPILAEIYDKGFHKMEYQCISGVDFFLGNMQREIEEARRVEEFMSTYFTKIRRRR